VATKSVVMRGLAILIGSTLAMLAQGKDLVLAEVHPQGHVIVQSEELLGTRLAELSKNDVRLQLKPNGELCDETHCWDKIKAGSLDMARVNLATLAKDLPAVKLLSLPYLFRSREHMWHVLAGDFGKRIEAEADKNGAVVLTYYDSGERSFYTTKGPIRSVADFNGLRIRIQDSPVYRELIQQLGGTPVVVPYDKVADAFKSGQIDAAENNTTSYVSSGHYKFAKYYSLDAHSSVPEVLLVSKKAWLSLTPAEQKALREAAAESSVYMKKQWAESEAQSLAKAKKEGAVITEKSSIAMVGIEGFAVKLYSKFITDSNDLNTVVNILRTK